MHGRRPAGTAFTGYTFLIALVILLCGCDALPLAGLGDASRPRPTGDMPPVQDPVNEDGVGNDAFESAQPATLPVDGEFTIHGAIDSRGDIDLYALGPAVAGDRVTLDVTGHNGLNTVAGLFDGDRDLLDANDDRSYYAGQVDPYVSHVLRADTPNLFVGVAVARATHFASSAGRYDSGTYSIRLIRRPGQPFLPPRNQVAWLDFRGGASVQIALQPVEIMRPFSAEAISARHAGQTERMASLVVELVREDFAACNVTILDGRYEAPPAGAYTRLYFGNYNPAYLGLSDSVDTGNAYPDQDAIIYTEDLAMFEGLQPSVEEIAMAIANVASHELGHLLGLEHTSEASDIMATAASARQILETNCVFRRSRLEQGVFPGGWQDGFKTLMATVGANPTAAGARPIRPDGAAPAGKGPEYDWRDQVPVKVQMCGRCRE